jgi:ribonuclease BN (tRNA processing enzyme)
LRGEPIPMKLHLLGTGGYHPSDRRQTACLMLPEIGVVLDAGTGFYRVHNHVCTNTLDVFLTHAHLDHVVGITYLFDVVRGHDFERVTVHASPEKLDAVRTHLLNEALFPASPPCTFQPLAGEVTLRRGGRLTHFAVEHPGGAVGYRLDWPDRSMAYVTDTTAATGANYINAIRGVDLLVHECNFSDKQAELAARWGHSSLSEVARLAATAGVGRLVLSHLDPTAPEPPLDLAIARRIFTKTWLAEDGQILEF